MWEIDKDNTAQPIHCENKIFCFNMNKSMCPVVIIIVL